MVRNGDINQRRLRLLEYGLTDKEIAEIEKVTPQAISHWRKKRGIASQQDRKRKKAINMLKTGWERKQVKEITGFSTATIISIEKELGIYTPGKDVINKQKEQEILSLVSKGYSDADIARKLNINNYQTVSRYRNKHGLEPNVRLSNGPLSEEENEKRMYLYNQGYNDHEIANKTGRARETIWNWRRVRGLPPNTHIGTNSTQIITEEEEKRRRYLYKKGFIDHEIGEVVGVIPTSIARWRWSRGLKPNSKRGRESMTASKKEA